MENRLFDWADVAFGSKKPLRSLDAVFIAAPRQLGPKRFTQLVKEYASKANIIIGIAKEEYVDGFENQPQFRMLRVADIQSIIETFNRANLPHKIFVLSYFQRELPYIIEKILPKKSLFVNGSWKYSFHTLPTYYTVIRHGIPYALVSPFATYDEAITYTQEVSKEITFPIPEKLMTASEMLALADTVATQSFDYGFQTGLVIGKKVGSKYRYLSNGFNRVVPFQGFALHNGASRETHFSPPQDLNHYDTIHAEMDVLVQAQKQNMNLAGTTVFINLMPCPTCARVLTMTDIAEFVYRTDHSEGYAIKLLESCGKTIKRIV